MYVTQPLTLGHILFMTSGLLWVPGPFPVYILAADQAKFPIFLMYLQLLLFGIVFHLHVPQVWDHVSSVSGVCVLCTALLSLH